MEQKPILPKLTKNYILSHVTQEEIMEAYLGVRVQTSELICSPLRKDNNPTCGFRYSQYGKLRFRDFSNDFWGDCFDVVGRLIGQPTTHQGFALIMDDIAKRFKIHKYETDNSDYTFNYTPTDVLKPEQSFTTITIKSREWRGRDIKFWKRFGIDKYMLNYFCVLPCQEVYISNAEGDMVLDYVDSYYKPAYAYYLGTDDKGRDLVKIYYPYHKIRFKTNTSILQGIHRLAPAGRVCVVTKSYKDVMSMFGFRLFGDRIFAVAPSSESTIITPEDFNMLNNRFDYVVSLYDFDKLGSIRSAYKMWDNYRVNPLFFTNGNYGTKDYGAKDFSDMVDIHGREHMNDILESIENYYLPYIELNELEINNYMNNVIHK